MWFPGCVADGSVKTRHDSDIRLEEEMAELETASEILFKPEASTGELLGPHVNTLQSQHGKDIYILILPTDEIRVSLRIVCI